MKNALEALRAIVAAADKNPNGGREVHAAIIDARAFINSGHSQETPILDKLLACDGCPTASACIDLGHCTRHRAWRKST